MRPFPTSPVIAIVATCALLAAPAIARAMDAEFGRARAITFAQKKRIAPPTKKKAAPPSATVTAAAAPSKKTARVLPPADSLFQAIAGKDSLISKEELTTYLDSRPAASRSAAPSQLAEQLFQYLDLNRDGALNQREFTDYAVFIGGAPAAPVGANGRAGAAGVGAPGRGGAGRALAAGGFGTPRDSAAARAASDSMFRQLAGKDSTISKDQLRKMLEGRPIAAQLAARPQLVDRLFTLLDANSDGAVNIAEFSRLPALTAALGGRGRGVPPPPPPGSPPGSPPVVKPPPPPPA